MVFTMHPLKGVCLLLVIMVFWAGCTIPEEKTSATVQMTTPVAAAPNGLRIQQAPAELEIDAPYITRILPDPVGSNKKCFKVFVTVRNNAGYLLDNGLVTLYYRGPVDKPDPSGAWTTMAEDFRLASGEEKTFGPVVICDTKELGVYDLTVLVSKGSTTLASREQSISVT